MTPAPRHALVTGAASGIGHAVACLLVEKGWRVAMLDLDGKVLGPLAARLGSRALPLAADVTDPDSIARAVATFSQGSGGTLDLLVNCAGLLYTGHAEEQTPGQLARLLGVNNLGPALCCFAALPQLRHSAAQGRRPAVVNLSSASAAFGIPGMAAYSASKFWVKGFTEALAVEWAGLGIAVRDVMPPFVNTPMLAGKQQNPFIRRLGVRLSPQAVARQVLAAASGGPLHRAVSWQFKLMLVLSRPVPAGLIRLALAWIGGYRVRD